MALAPFVLTVWPPASGRMLIVPYVGNDSNAVAQTAVTAGALLVGPGPVRGSLVVMGDRSKIIAGLDRRSFIVLAAPPAGCGQSAATGIAT